ncbi:hypothetical protein EON65_00170 [archaeon]|nr:MAG: hypothetical protein EON65_00170 [archaeon]
MKVITSLLILSLVCFLSKYYSFVPDYENLEHFRTLTLTYDVYKHWPNFNILEKLPYLVDRSYLNNLKADFFTSAETVAEDGSQAITKMYLQHSLQDFITEAQFHSFFNDCDSNHDDMLNWTEYVICRGSYDSSGNPHDVSEFDYLENIVISDFAEKLNDPNDPMVLELIEKGEL